MQTLMLFTANPLVFLCAAQEKLEKNKRTKEVLEKSFYWHPELGLIKNQSLPICSTKIPIEKFIIIKKEKIVHSPKISFLTLALVKVK